MNVTQFVVMLSPRAAHQTSSVGGKRWRLEKDVIARAKPFQKAAMLGKLVGAVGRMTWLRYTTITTVQGLEMVIAFVPSLPLPAPSCPDVTFSPSHPITCQHACYLVLREYLVLLVGARALRKMVTTTHYHRLSCND